MLRSCDGPKVTQAAGIWTNPAQHMSPQPHPERRWGVQEGEGWGIIILLEEVMGHGSLDPGSLVGQTATPPSPAHSLLALPPMCCFLGSSILFLQRGEASFTFPLPFDPPV